MSVNTVKFSIFTMKKIEESNRESFKKDFIEKVKSSFVKDDAGYSLCLKDDDFYFEFDAYWKKSKDYDWQDYETSIDVQMDGKGINFLCSVDKFNELFDFINEIHCEIEFYMDESKEWYLWTNNERVQKDLEEKYEIALCGGDCAKITIDDSAFHKEKYKLANITDEQYENSLGKDEDEEGYIDDDKIQEYLDENVDGWWFELNSSFEEKACDFLQNHTFDSNFLEVEIQ